MAGRDLRALFSTNDRSLATEEAFTNRQAQWELIAAALTEHLRHTADPAFDVEDLEAPRDNVMVFHGVGGIGKTTLSRKLEAALGSVERRPAQWGAPTWAGERILPVRIDLARSAGTDFEHVMLTIRLALAELGRPLPAFDLALRRYWDHQHPGEPLEEYLRRGGLASRFGKALPQQMQSALGDIAQALLLPGTVGSVVGEVTGSLVRALREHRQSVRALAGCTRLADLLQAEPDVDALSYYPHLLAWELAKLPADKRIVPVILLDTFEDTGDRTHRDLERLLQRVVWLMPNAFFLVTGRSRLQWADEGLQGQLDWTGPSAWPGLAAHDIPVPRHAAGVGHGRQILIGDFSPEDCKDYLARRLTHDGRPLISESLRTVIADRSHGLPLYLDLAVMRFLEIRRTGRTPQPADFDINFPALIARTLSDLTPDERHVLRSVALLDSFDLPLATRAAGMTHEAPALRLVERPFVRENPIGMWPFHLHALIRSTIRTADDQTDDRWSPHDWQQAAERAFAGVGEQWATSTAPGRMLLVGCLRQGLAVARDFRLELGWLAEATWQYVSDSVWEPLAPPASQDPTDTLELETPADALMETLSALARRQHEHRERTVTRLTTVINTRLLPPTCTTWSSTTAPRPTAISGAAANRAVGCSTLPMGVVASRPARDAAWHTSPVLPETSPPPSKLPARSAGLAATTASWAMCGGPRPRWRGQPPRTQPHGTRLSSTASPANGPSPRPSALSSSPSPIPTRPTTNSHSPSSSSPESICAPPLSPPRSPPSSATPEPQATSKTAHTCCAPTSAAPAWSLPRPPSSWASASTTPCSTRRTRWPVQSPGYAP
ncbi:hypothetical protein [Streptomyces sp. NBC_00154]|uniref:hypothetical protein n=1 Tax=Streptomyces sp. NBC_00154 TaxID=2975670 RepID=UPI002B1D884D|nr:hypothetical protein [Streptomyces sp. NBC_00154]